MFGADAFLLANLAGCGGTHLAGSAHDLSGVSGALRPLAERLLGASLSERQTIWNEFLAGRLGQVRAGAIAAAPDPTLGLVVRPAIVPLAQLENPHELLSPRPVRAEAVPCVKMTCVGDLEPREVEWLWDGRVPLGMITMFAGDPKLGKSFVTLEMAAALSRGLPLPQSDLPNRPASTILMSAEDDPARTIAQRLKVAGADVSKIHLLQSVNLANGLEALPSLLSDMNAISAAAAALGDCKLIVIDPVSAYLKGVDDNRNAALRGVFSPLRDLAERLGAAVVLVSHLTKARSANGKHRVLGSIAYVGACRANSMFARDPCDPLGLRVIMFDNGGNTGPLALPLAFTIEDRTGRGPQVSWSNEPVTITLEQALRSKGRSSNPGDDPELSECEEWLKETLAGGQALAAEVRRAAQAAGFSLTTLHRARTAISAATRRVGFGPGSKLYWQLCDRPGPESTSTIDSTFPPP